MRIRDLIAQAEKALVPADDTESLTREIEAYSEAFSSWQAQEPDPRDAEDLETLSKLHARIIERVEDLKKQTSTDLRNLKKKGKGILAYTDVLPKRISLGRKRKG